MAKALREFAAKTIIIPKETQSKARSLDSAADEAQISLHDSLRSQAPATQGRDQMQLTPLIMLVIICIDNKSLASVINGDQIVIESVVLTLQVAGA